MKRFSSLLSVLPTKQAVSRTPLNLSPTDLTPADQSHKDHAVDYLACRSSKTSNRAD
ncbi:hypothetical protein CsSME_00028589 [Camellia sinensis var. sinensis]